MDHPVFPRKFAPVNQYIDTLGRIRKILMGWKTEFDVAQKEARFVHALGHAPNLLHPVITGDEVNFSHSGHTGDVIYAMPAMYALANGRKINLYLRLNQPATEFTKKMRHPNGNVMLTEKSVQLFSPLLSAQPGINLFAALGNEEVHYDLSMFKAFPFDYRMSSITRYFLFSFGVSYPLHEPWLHVTPDHSFNDAIVIARSSRYRTPGIDYSILKKYPRVVFVGLPDEFEDMHPHIPHMQYKSVANFLELAEVIAGSKLFIGNQSFPFALAEALKAKRMLEVYYQCPNVTAEGPGAHEFCYQPQFEKMLSDLLDN
jgi:hypothetical protein